MSANPNDVKKAEYYVEQFEKIVAQAKGRDIGKTHQAKAAMSRVKKLAKDHPDDPSVKELVERVRNALKGSKGETFKITAEMLAYKKTESDVLDILASDGESWWTNRLEELDAAGKLMEPVFPIKDPMLAGDAENEDGGEDDGNDEEVYVHLTDIRYPDNLFKDSGRSMLFVGEPSKGFYFLDVSDQDFRSAYAAVQRFQKTISGEVSGEWEVIGRIERSKLAVPDPSPNPTRDAEFGWLVDVEAIRLVDRCVTIADDTGEGVIVSEEKAKTAMQSAYTITELSDEATPEEVVITCATAVKEKNLDLVKRTMHEAWFVTPIAEARFDYRYQRNIERFDKFYVHVEPEPDPVITVLQGEAIDDDESFFLTEDDAADILAHADPLVEQAEVRVRRYNERGKQEGSPAPVFLRRTEGGPWRIWEGFPV